MISIFKKKRLEIPTDKLDKFLELSIKHTKVEKEHGSVGAHIERMALWEYIYSILPETRKGSWQCVYTVKYNKNPYMEKM